MQDVVIAGYVRSPFHPAMRGALARARADDLAANTVRGLIERTGVKPDDIEDLVMGCAFPEGEQGFNIGRLVALLADLPLSVGGMTLNRFCGSSMSAIHYAAGQILAGAGEAFICAGVESMSRVPMTGFNPMPNPALARTSAAYMSMGETAENVARKYEISRASRTPSRWPASRRPPPRLRMAILLTRSCRSPRNPAMWSSMTARPAPRPRWTRWPPLSPLSPLTARSPQARLPR